MPAKPCLDEYAATLAKASILSKSERNLNEAFASHDLEKGLKVVQNFEKEALKWDSQLETELLPGFLGLWESLLVDPWESEQLLLTGALKFGWIKCSYRFTQALVHMCSGSANRALEVLEDTWNLDPDNAAAELLSKNAAAAIRSKRSLYHRGQSEELKAVINYFGWMAYIIMYSQVEEIQKTVKDRNLRVWFINEIIKVSVRAINHQSYFSTLSMEKTYELYRNYMFDLLVLRARATYQEAPRVSTASYILIFEFLNNGSAWSASSASSPENLFEEIFDRIGLERPSYYSSRKEEIKSPLGNHQAPFPYWDPKGYYHILEIGKNATISQIKKAFRALSLIHHPDKGGRTADFQVINQANSILSNPSSKDVYDKTGR